MKKKILVKRSKSPVFFYIALLIFLYGDTYSNYAQDNLPQRIISLAPALTEQLYLLGVEDKIVGVTTYCQRPYDAQKKEKIGTIIRINIEKIVSLKPDLVLELSMADPKQIDKLKKIGIKVISFPQPKDFPGICDQFLEIGKLVGKENKAGEIINIAKKKVDSIKEKVTQLEKPKVFVQIGAKPLFTVTKDSFIHDFIEFAGGINIAEETKTGLYNREEVIKKNPDVIIIVTMGIAGEQEKQTWQRYNSINATKNERIYVIDSYKICSPTPVSFVEALEEIVKLIHTKK